MDNKKQELLLSIKIIDTKQGKMRMKQKKPWMQINFKIEKIKVLQN
jgi:hypothetical protein